MYGDLRVVHLKFYNGEIGNWKSFTVSEISYMGGYPLYRIISKTTVAARKACKKWIKMNNTPLSDYYSFAFPEFNLKEMFDNEPIRAEVDSKKVKIALEVPPIELNSKPKPEAPAAAPINPQKPAAPVAQQSAKPVAPAAPTAPQPSGTTAGRG